MGALLPTTANGSGSVGFLRGLATVLANRLQFARNGFNTQYSGRRDLNLILGYDEYIDITNYRYEYERGGIAKRIVEALPRASWSTGFEIVEDENLKRLTPLEKSLSQLLERLDGHQRLIRASILAGIGHYSCLLIGAPGNLDTELPRGSGAESIAYLWPLGEDKITIESLVGQAGELPSDPRYGLPKYYQLNLSGRANLTNSPLFNSAANTPLASRVHWSRVVHITSGALDSEIYGEPTLRPVWNLLHDLKKCTGGGAEAGLRRGWPGLHASVDKEAALTADERNAIKEELDDYNVGMLNALLTRRTTLTPIATTGQINIKDNASAILEQIAGTIGYPMRVLRGAERGEQASDQDRDNWGDRVSEYRMSHNEPTIRQLTKRLIDYGYVPPARRPKWTIEWPQEEEFNEIEKADAAKKMAESKIWTVDEIRDRVYDAGPKPKEEVTDANPGVIVPGTGTPNVDDDDGSDDENESKPED